MVFDSQSGSASWCSLRVPVGLCACLEDRKTQTHYFEMLATLCAVVTFGDLLRNRRVLFFCDSTTAMSAAVHADRAHRRYVYGYRSAFGVLSLAVPAVVRVGTF